MAQGTGAPTKTDSRAATAEVVADVVPRTFRGRRQTILVNRWGLVVRRAWRRDWHIWWEEVRRVDWPEHGLARVWLVGDTLELDPTLGDLRELVELLSAAAASVRAQWHGRPLGGRKLARWFGLRGERALTMHLAGAARRRVAQVALWLLRQCLGRLPLVALLVAIGALAAVLERGELLALLVYAGLALVMNLLPGRRRLGLFFDDFPVTDEEVEAEAVRGCVLELLVFVFGYHDWWPAPTAQQSPDGSPPTARRLRVTRRGLEVDGRSYLWEQVRVVNLRQVPGSHAQRLALELDGAKAGCDLSPVGAHQALHAFQLLADLSQREFHATLDEPPPDGAISLAPRQLGDQAERGLSRVGEEDP